MKKSTLGRLAMLALCLALTLSLLSCSSIYKSIYDVEGEPTVRHGEFDFSITYEINGAQNTVYGVYVCEYKGISADLTGWYYDWETSVTNTNISSDALDFHGNTGRFNIIIGSNQDGVLSIYTDLDPDNCMMYDSEKSYSPEPMIQISYNEDRAEELGYTENDQEILTEKYNVRIVSFEYDPPIVNPLS